METSRRLHTIETTCLSSKFIMPQLFNFNERGLHLLLSSYQPASIYFRSLLVVSAVRTSLHDRDGHIKLTGMAGRGAGLVYRDMKWAVKNVKK